MRNGEGITNFIIAQAPSVTRTARATFLSEEGFGKSEQPSLPRDRASNDADSEATCCPDALSLQFWWVIVCLCAAEGLCKPLARMAVMRVFCEFLFAFGFLPFAAGEL